MTSLDAAYRQNEPDVISESVDGEALIINLRSGAYYSSDGAGDQIWGLVVAGLPLADVAARLGACYGLAPAVAERSVLDFAAELEREGLVVPLAAPAAATAEVPALSNGHVFATPELHKYTDFQELLLLDPIHEVDQSLGWPAPR